MQKTVEALHRVGVGDERIATVIGSMEDPTTPERIVKAAVDRFGKIDVLVGGYQLFSIPQTNKTPPQINNAGQTGKLEKYEPNAIEVCDLLYAVNFRSVALLTKLAMPHLIATKGNVVNVSSISADFAFPTDDLFYCSLKAALNHFSRVSANLYGPQGVRVNVVSPGPVETRILDPSRGVKPIMSANLTQWAAKNTVLGRIGHTSETSTVLTFLASEDARYVTGAELVVDGGALVKGPSLT